MPTLFLLVLQSYVARIDYLLLVKTLIAINILLYSIIAFSIQSAQKLII
jgi:hypothetical protein